MAIRYEITVKRFLETTKNSTLNYFYLFNLQVLVKLKTVKATKATDRRRKRERRRSRIRRKTTILEETVERERTRECCKIKTSNEKKKLYIGPKVSRGGLVQPDPSDILRHNNKFR